MLKNTKPLQRHCTLFIAALLLCSNVKAQSQVYTIKWTDTTRTFQLNDYKRHTVLYFSKASYDVKKYSTLPCFVSSFPVNEYGKMTVEILNPQYAALTRKQQEIIEPLQAHIALTPVATGTIISARGQYTAGVTVLPFRKNPLTNAVEKLVSFQLSYTIDAYEAREEKRNMRGGGYAANSVLASGTWYKIPVNQDGIYKIDKAYLTTLGISAASVNPQDIRIFNNGAGVLPEANAAPRYDDLQENAVLVHGGANGVFDDTTYVLFYGQSPHQWYYDTIAKRFYHVVNIYSDQTFYFLTVTDGAGKRIPSLASSTATPNVTVNEFDDHQYHEADLVNLEQSGRAWYGEDFQFNTNQTFSFSFPNMDVSQPVQICINVASRSFAASKLFSATANGQNLGSVSIPHTVDDDNDPYANPGNICNGVTLSSGSINVNINYQNPANDGDGWLYYIEVNCKSFLNYSGSPLEFRSEAAVGASNVSRFNLSGVNKNILVWDVTDPLNIAQQQYNLNGSTASFVAATPTLRSYIAFNSAGPFSTPLNGSKVVNQNLHSTGQVDYVIVAPASFMGPANSLATFHQQNQNLKTVVVTPQQCFNEFSCGAEDLSAIRDYMRMLYVRAQNGGYAPPSYLLLLGGGSYDYKNRTANNTNYIPIYESVESIDQVNTFCTDDYYACLDDDEGQDMTAAEGLDVYVGRIPANSLEEANTAVSKIEAYKATCNFGTWQNDYVMVADVYVEGPVFLDDAETVLSYIPSTSSSSSYPSSVWDINKIYLDAYQPVTTPAGQITPSVNTAIDNAIYNGALMINYVGHGGTLGWSHNRILQIADINSWTNGSKLPLFITATCEFTEMDDPAVNSAGQQILFKTNGGGIALVSTVRLVYEFANTQLNEAFTTRIFEHEGTYYHTLGKAFTLGKNDVINMGTSAVNTRKFMLVGDPGIYLDYPHDTTVSTQISTTVKPFVNGADTIKALERVTVKGKMVDGLGHTITGFSGIIYPIIYDKPEKVQTLGDYKSATRIFQLQQNILYKGKATVSNGLYTYTFIVPKDINFQYGVGKISYFANTSTTDANGFNTMVVGGVSDTTKISKTGPQIKLYMNDDKFVFGGVTNTSPYVYMALRDPAGINTTGNGIGHDITGILDANTQSTFVMNQFYQANQDDFTSGTVTYPLSGLTIGRHTIDVQAWDAYDNPSTAYTEFVVASSASLALENVLNYPNPFTTSTEFMFDENMPGSNLTISVEIFSVSGRLVKTLRTNVLNASSMNSLCCTASAGTGTFHVDGIMWDGKDDYGSPIGKGVYIYRVSVRTDNGLKADKYEKLVLLK